MVGVVSRQCRRPVTEETRFTTDLRLDSIGTMDLIAELEDHFGVVVAFEDAREIESVGDAARHLVALLAAEAEAPSGSGA